MVRLFLIIRLFFIVFYSVSLHAQIQLAQIRGRVVDAKTNLPVKGAELHIRHLPVRVLSDSTGQFRLGQVPLGLVEFQVTKEGYEQYITPVNVSPKAYQIDVRLEPKTKSQPKAGLDNVVPYQERAYLHTDKPYYYPGEIIWMKAYVQYVDITKRDSLSRTLFVDLIDANKNIVKSMLLSVDSGRWQASLVLPRDLTPGMYGLRAYTRFMLNFNDANRIFTKLVPVLAQQQRVDGRSAPAARETTPESPEINSQPSTTSTRSKVSITMKPDVDVKNLSVSVVDATQVPLIPEADIQRHFQRAWEPVDEFEPRFIVDKGICFLGTVLSEMGRPKKATMTIYRENMEEFLDFETDEQGRFTINGLKFYDSAKWFYQSKGKKGKASFGTIKIDPWQPPATEALPGVWFRTETAASAQRILPDYLIPLEARVLEEVVIASTKLEEKREIPGIVGGADQVIDAQKLVNTGNLLLALQGKVVGLNITCVGGDCRVFYSRAQTNTFSGSIEPLVLINNTPAFGTAGQVLSQLDINQVERIEFSRRINVLYGEQGRNGIISVYLKAGAVATERDSGIQSFTLNGFHKPLTFLSPDYANVSTETDAADYRSTIYWNPELTPDSTGTFRFEFYTSDLPGPYRITVEGLSNNGQPVRYQKYIQVVAR